MILCGSTEVIFRKIPDLFKLMAVVFLQVYSPLPHHSLVKNCRGVLQYADLHNEAPHE